MAASNENKGYLTNKQIVRLAAAISANNMAAIVEGYMDIPSETIKNKKYENKDDAEAFNREILKYWCNKNSDNTQIQRLGRLLREAISENSYGNPRDIEKILGLSLTEDVAAVKSLKEEELNEIADDLRPWTEQAMKIELAPWAESLTGDMETLYTELKLENTEDTPAGYKNTPITDYKDMFKDGTPTSKPKRKRILGKGDPGIGKTTFSKKAAWDWAKGIFTVFSIVFFVSLKLIQTGDTIENMIIQQTPVLEGLNVTEEKLKHILDTFGSKCLIILDGYDEFASENKENKDLSMLFKGQKFPRCSVLLTSRPHCVADIRVHFQSVVNIKGFTKELARKFASDALIDPSQVDSVLEIQCLNVGDHVQPGGSLYASPMLLLFICILVNNHEIKPQRNNITLGEIFWKLIRCIYRKYCLTRGIDFVQNQFLALVNKVSIIAYETYILGEYFFKQEELFEQLGKDAFSYGFLIGREDTRLMPESSTNVIVTFPHRSIEEFFCSLGLVSIMSPPFAWVLPSRTPIFLINPLIFKFCLWFMYHGSEHCLYSICTAYVLRVMRQEISRLCDNVHLDLHEIGCFYSVLNIRYAVAVNDIDTLTFFKKMLLSFRKTKHLTVVPDTAVWTLETLRHILKQLSVLTIQSYLYFKLNLPEYFTALSAEKSEELTVIIRGDCQKFLDVVMGYPEISQRHPSVYLSINTNHDLSSLLHKDMKELHLSDPFCKWCLTANQDLVLCAHLTDLSFTSAGNMKVDPNVLSALSTAVQAGKLPCLDHLSFSGCGTAIKGHLPKLFSSEWTTLKHLNLYRCELAKTDVNYLAKHHDRLFPNILSLVLYFGKCKNPNEDEKLSSYASVLLDARQKGEIKIDLAVKILFNSPWPTLISLYLHDLTTEAHAEFSRIITKGQLPNLKKLGISMWYIARVIPSNLPPFKPCNGCDISHLTLQQVSFRKEYWSILTNRPFVNQLQKLDISHSFGVAGNLSSLVCHPLPEIHTLILNNCELNTADLCSLAQANKMGKLPKLRHLDILANPGNATYLFTDSCTWNNLLEFKVSHYLINESSDSADVKSFDLQSEKLASLQELSLILGQSKLIPVRAEKKWMRLKTLTIISDGNQNLLDSLINAVENGVFPELRMVRLANYPKHIILPYTPDFALRLRLRQSNIMVQCFYMTGKIDFF